MGAQWREVEEAGFVSCKVGREEWGAAVPVGTWTPMLVSMGATYTAGQQLLFL